MVYVEQLLKEHKKLEEKGQVWFLLYLWTGNVVLWTVIDHARSLSEGCRKTQKCPNPIRSVTPLPPQVPTETCTVTVMMKKCLQCRVLLRLLEHPVEAGGSCGVRALGGPAPSPPLQCQHKWRSSRTEGHMDTLPTWLDVEAWDESGW